MQSDKNISRKLRLGTMLLDHAIICFGLGVPFVLVCAIPAVVSHGRIMLFAVYGGPIMFAFLAVYINKDWFAGQSLSKRILGLQIVDCRTGNPASELRCLIRNLTIPLWPIEVAFSLFNTHRRIGDYLAGTRLEVTEKRPLKSLITDMKSFRFRGRSILALAASILFVLLTFSFSSHGSFSDLLPTKKSPYVFQRDDGQSLSGQFRYPSFPAIVKEHSGHFIAYHPNGEQWFDRYYTNGLAHGRFVVLREDGTKEFETTYLHGEEHGKMIWWYRNGNKMTECEWVHGKKHGDWVDWDRDGKEKHRASFIDGVRQSQ